MTDIILGTAARLGLRKPTGTARCRGRSLVSYDDVVAWATEAVAGDFELRPFQLVYLNDIVTAKRG